MRKQIQSERPQRATRSSTRGVQKPVQSSRQTKTASRTAVTSKRRTKSTVLPQALQEYHKQSDVDPNACTALLRQPREVFDLIASYLQPETLVCLSLSCKLALQYIGSSCWNDPDIRSHRLHSRLYLMQCLIRDAPNGLTFCQYCNTLHPPLQPPRTHRETKLTKICMSQWAVVDFFPQVRDEDQKEGYSLLHPHIQEVFDKRGIDPSTISLLSGNYATSKNPGFDYELASSAAWIKDRLVLQHTHIFRPKSRTALKVTDILMLPVRICPHISTSTSAPPKSRYLPTRPANSPLLTHAIAAAFPLHQRSGVPKPSTFRDPTPLEKKQLDRADAGDFREGKRRAKDNELALFWSGSVPCEQVLALVGEEGRRELRSGEEEQ
ncbi:hypothetical protein N0V90_006871 [Kalmusia sp. IMI 367209]|nr:hypothetical protein N0V90_006871 [Kalmusia sp. IMI 367209]